MSPCVRVCGCVCICAGVGACGFMFERACGCVQANERAALSYLWCMYSYQGGAQQGDDVARAERRAQPRTSTDSLFEFARDPEWQST